MACTCSEQPNYSEESLCSYCTKNKALDELAIETQELEKLFSPEQKEFKDD